jgi:hypothetical protein
MSARKGRRRPRQKVPCGWCGQSITLANTGRVPKWCSQVCRQRAWVHRQPAAEDRAVVEVVDHVVEVEVERRLRVVERVEVVMQPKGAEWPSVLGQLVKQLDSGRLHDRDLQALAVAVSEVLNALTRRLSPPRGRR